MSEIAEEKYQAELIQSDKDHHTPTAGAMIGHIIANLAIHQTKLRQAAGYLKGCKAILLHETLQTMIAEEVQKLDVINKLMLDEGEVIPTTTAEYQKYTMLEESGQLKYEPAETILQTIVQDIATQRLFVTRGIALAEKEQKFGLELFLKEFDTWCKHQIFLIQTALGREVGAGLEEDEDDDED